MTKLSEELEFILDRLVEKRIEEESFISVNDEQRRKVREWIYNDFAEWLVKKFEKEIYKNG